MGFSLSSLFHYDNQNTGASAGQSQAAQAASSDGASHFHAANELKNLLPGQTISGEIVAVRDGEVDIALGKDMVLTAKLERDMNIAVGQTLTFEIKSNSNSLISLRPLFENLSQNLNVANAIKASHIPFNQKSIEMVSLLMEEGLPIDKQTLQALYKQLVLNPQIDLNTIMQMNRLKIPLTPENILQFENYRNYEHSIMSGVETVADDIVQALGEALKSGNEQQIRELYQKLTQIFTENGGQTTAAATKGNANAAAGELIMLNQAVDSNTNLKGSTNPVMAEGNANAVVDGNTRTDGSKISDETIIIGGNNVTGDHKTASKVIITEGNPAESANADTQKEAGGIAANNRNMVLEAPERELLANLFKEAGAPEKLVQLISSGNMSVEETLQFVNQLLMKGSLAGNDSLKQLLGSKEFSKLLKTQITRQWMLEPAEVAKEGKVEQLYERMQQQTAKLTEAIMGMAKENPALAKSVSTLSNNVEFMNQLNQTFTYVQLPLKMSNQNAHGDLYVYTNKKNLAKKDGNVSALLHLDLEQLGTLDIYVAMQNQNVNTKFYLQKEEYMDLLADNLPILFDKLEKRGYAMTAEVLLSEKKVNVIEEIAEQNKNTNRLAKYSFDVRA